MDGAETKLSHSKTKAATYRRFVPWIVVALVFSICLPLYYSTAKKREAIFNPNNENSSFLDSTDTDKVKVHVIFHHDQHVYMNLGRLLKRSNYDYFLPRQRTPGYPILLSLLYDESLAYEGEPGDA